MYLRKLSDERTRGVVLCKESFPSIVNDTNIENMTHMLNKRKISLKKKQIKQNRKNKK